jgi:hypothetical protein
MSKGGCDRTGVVPSGGGCFFACSRCVEGRAGKNSSELPGKVKENEDGGSVGGGDGEREFFFNWVEKELACSTTNSRERREVKGLLKGV